ncbi:hypothetical protein L6164_022306 [Bauhinia variegata]|uniref:Uncharacterized protein n=1 Tax=Bauhinia variegata TaxID=167791 RepID=A0ACB9MEU4_BAUVA|nr:hypothetical protein L6164_022306 [Bauhinia variegata]
MNLNDSSEIIDSQANDFSLANSFLNFDSIKDYFEDKPATDMVAQENNKSNQCLVETTILDKSNRVLKLENTESRAGECENLGSSSCTIQEGLGKISLVLGNDGKSEMMNGEHESESSESESADPSSPSPSSSYHSNSSSDSGSGSTTSDDDNEEEECQEEKREEKREDIDVEIEER